MTSLIEALFYYPFYLVLAIVVVVVMYVIGDTLINKGVRGHNLFLDLALKATAGLLVVIVVLNAISYILPPPLSFGAIAVIAILLTVRQARRLTRDSVRQIMSAVKEIALPALALYTLLFLVTFRQYNFDEELHRPVVSSLLTGNFPIHHPLNPFWMLQYSYHYGWQLFAALVAWVSRLPIPDALDIVKYVGLFIGVSFAWGLGGWQKLPPLPRVFVVGAFFLSGAFWFFRDAFLTQYLLGIKQELIGFSLFHNLQSISYHSVLLLLVVLYLVYLLLTQKWGSWNKFLWPSALLTIVLMGLSLTGEFQLAMLYVTIGLAILVKAGIDFAATKRFRIPISSALVLAALLMSFFGSIIQGGLLTGVVRPTTMLDPSLPQVASHFADEGTTYVIDDPNKPAQKIGQRPVIGIRSLNRWGFVSADAENEYYVPLFDWQRVLPAVGLPGLLIIPTFFIWGAYYLFRHRRKLPENFISLLTLMALIFYITPMILTTKFGDQNLSRGTVMTVSTMVALATGALFRLRTASLGVRAAKILLGGLVFLSTLPTIGFNVGVFLFQPELEPPPRSKSVLVDRSSFGLLADTYSEETKNELAFFAEVARYHPTGWIMTSMEESRYFTEQTGALSFGNFFRKNPAIYDRLLARLSPNDLEALGVRYVYVSPFLRRRLSPEAKENLQHFPAVVRQGEGDAAYELFALTDEQERSD